MVLRLTVALMGAMMAFNTYVQVRDKLGYPSSQLTPNGCLPLYKQSVVSVAIARVVGRLCGHV